MEEKKDLSEFMHMAVSFSKKYLACGGPSSRLEKRLSHVGETQGYKTDVFATPTGIFISSIKGKHETQTLIGRIKDTSINLAQLYRLEKILSSISQGELTPKQAISKLKQMTQLIEYPYWIVLLSAFLMGFGCSYPKFSHSSEAILSGLVTVVVIMSTNLISRFVTMSGVFFEFFGCFLALCIAGFFSYYGHLTGDAIVIGTLVYLVPGLTFTNAISELAEHNFVSGTAKTMRGILTLLAIGIAFFIFRDIGQLMGLHENLNIHPEVITVQLPFYVKLICHLFIVLGFAIIFQCPRKAIPWALLTGFLSWFVLGLFATEESYILASFTSSLVVGVVSLTLSRIFHMPSQIFSVPGVLSLVPGLLSLGTLSSFVGENSNQGHFGMQVALIASAIVFGLFSARLPFMLTPKRVSEELLD